MERDLCMCMIKQAIVWMRLGQRQTCRGCNLFSRNQEKTIDYYS